MKPEQIRQILDGMSVEVVKDVAAMLLAQGHASDTSAKKKIIDSSDFKNFSQAIVYLKRNYKFKELDRFTTEADLVYVDTGDRKVLLNVKDDTKKKESTSSRFANLDYDSEDSYFENAWEPLRKEKKKDDRPSQPEPDPLAALSDTSPVAATSERESRFEQPAATSSSDSKRDDEPEPFGRDDSSSHSGGRFKNLEL